MARLGGDKNYILQVYVDGSWNDIGLTSTAYMDPAGAINEFGTVFPTYENFKVVDYNNSKYAEQLQDGNGTTIAYFVTPEQVQSFAAQYSPFSVSIDGNLLTITYTTPSAATTTE